MTVTFEYQQTRRFFAQVPDGMEALAAEEISELGAKGIRTAYRGVHFEAELNTLYRVNYSARCLARILAPLLSFRCHTYEVLYRRARQVEWSRIFTPRHSFAVVANVSNSSLRHSRYAALSLKDAIVDHFRERLKARPDVERSEPDLRINLHIEGNRATLSLDTSGESLHRRGYREEALEAAMQETLAAAVIRLTRWDGSTPFYDPMCGSGTLLAEALMQYCRIPAGFLRKHFGFRFLPDHDENLWHKVRQEENRRRRELPEGLISGSDISQQAADLTRANLRRLPHGERVEIRTIDFRKLTGLQNTTIVCDPPYGIRTYRNEDLGDLYKALGDFLKQRCRGSVAFIYFGNRKLISKVGLKTSWKVPLTAGGLDGRLAKYELY
ncbi:MAG: class I SAM-dependent RNA methyltransferase [Thermodesulfobacteriota bacterium]